MRRAIVRGGIAILAALAVVAALGLLYRAWRQHEVARELATATPPGIAEAMFVRIGGIDQFIRIRGDDRANPVMLFVHGGPGNSMMPFARIFRPWEKHFTLVQWDQRGSGKTFGRNGEAGENPMTIDRITRDGIEVAQYLRAHLHKHRIVLLGHSWGSMIGVRMVKLRPDLFSAYVGTGQVVAKEEKEEILYARLMAKLLAEHDERRIRELRALGPPPYRSQKELLIERGISSHYDVPSERNLEDMMTPVVLFAPDYSLMDIHDFLEAPKFASRMLYRETLGYDARTLGPDFAVPFFVFQGDADTVTPADLAKAYFDSVQAPVKGYAVLRGGGHSAVMTMPDTFLKELLARVRPVAMER